MEERSQSRKEARDIHAMWGAIDRLQLQQGELSTQMAQIGSKMDLLAESLHRVMDSADSASHHRWPTVFAGAAVLLSIIVSGGGAALAPLYLSDSHTRYTLERHMNLPGHPEAMVLHAQTERDIKRLDGDIREVKQSIVDNDQHSRERHDRAMEAIKQMDTNLQREMRDLDQTQIVRLNSADDKLLNEMQLRDEIEAAKREALELKIDSLDKTIYSEDINAFRDEVVRGLGDK